MDCPKCGMVRTGEHEDYGCQINIHRAIDRFLEAREVTIEATVGECDVDDCPSCVAYRLAKAAIAAAEGE